MVLPIGSGWGNTGAEGLLETMFTGLHLPPVVNDPDAQAAIDVDFAGDMQIMDQAAFGGVNQVTVVDQASESALVIHLRSTASDPNGDGVIVRDVVQDVSIGEPVANDPPPLPSIPAIPSVPVKVGGNDDVLLGGRGNDALHAGSGDDLLIGRQGDDNLCGGGGRDLIRAGAGNDHLDGGLDVDVLIGGGGRDVYRVGLNTAAGPSSTGRGAAPDLIRGFDVRRDRLALPAGLTGDMIRFSGSLVLLKLPGRTLPLCELVGLDAEALASQIQIMV